MKQNAFSLVELSIVLVILGLLVGGILAGQSLIHASELRAIGTEQQRWMTATNAFRDKYFAIPGDFLTATSFWGDNATYCASAATTDGTPGTCNGDGNGSVWYGTAANVGENFLYWQHLALAGLIEGTYTGLAGPNNALQAVLNTNSPSSKLSGATWTMRDMGVRSGVVNLFDGTYKNTFIFGGVVSNNQADLPVISATDAWNIDTKLDDSMPALGKVMAYTSVQCAQQANGTAIPSTAAGSAMLTAVYKLSTDGNLCALLFPRSF